MSENKKKDLQALGGVLEGVYGKKSWKGQWDLFDLTRNWDKIIARDVARATMPAYFRHDVLWVFVENSAWMQHVQLMKLQMLEQVNKWLENREVASLRFLMQPVLYQQHQGKAVFDQPLKEPSPEKLVQMQQMTDTIADEDCRKALFSLWRLFEQHRD